MSLEVTQILLKITARLMEHNNGHYLTAESSIHHGDFRRTSGIIQELNYIIRVSSILHHIIKKGSFRERFVLLLNFS